MTYDWDKYEAEIRHYYREEHWTSEEVRNYINHRYGVSIQSRTLRHKLKEWGLRRVDTKNERTTSWRGLPSPAPVAYSQPGLASSVPVACPEKGSVGPAPVAYPQTAFANLASVVDSQNGSVGPASVVDSQNGSVGPAPVVYSHTGSVGPAPVVYSQSGFGSSAPVVYSQTGFGSSAPVVHPENGSVAPAPMVYSQTGFASPVPMLYPEDCSVGPARMANHAEDGSTQLPPGTGMGYIPVQSLQGEPAYVPPTPQPKQATHPQSLTTPFSSTRAQGVVEQQARPENSDWGHYQSNGNLVVNHDYTAPSDSQASQNCELTVSMEQIHVPGRQPLADLTTSHSIANNLRPSAYTLPSSTTSECVQGSTDPGTFPNLDVGAQWNAVQLWSRFPDSWSG